MLPSYYPLKIQRHKGRYRRRLYIHTLKHGNHLILSTTRFKQSHFEANTRTQVYAHPFEYTNNKKTSLFNGALYILSSNIFVHVLFILDCNAMTHVSTLVHAWKKTNLSINRTKFVVNSKYSYCLSSHIDARTHMTKFAAV